MARAHEQFGLRKPMHRAIHVCAVDGENLKLIFCNMPHPARQCARGSIGGRAHRISIPSQPRLSRRKLLKISDRHPVVVAGIFLEVWAEEKSEHRHRKHGADCAIQQQSHLEKKFPARVLARLIHWIFDDGFFDQVLQWVLHTHSCCGTSRVYFPLAEFSPAGGGALENGCPGNCTRCDPSQATTSVTSLSVIGLPDPSPRQSGIPSPAKPATTISRKPRSPISER